MEPAQRVGSPPGARSRPLCALFAGAHPDDVELGAGGLVQRLAQRGHAVWFLVLTDEPGCAATRRAEAVQAAAQLGVPESQVIFAGLADGHLRADRESVALVRRLVSTARITVDAVVTHSAADSHNEHADRLAHRGVLLQHAAAGVLQRHLPAAEGGELGTEGEMALVQRGPAELVAGFAHGGNLPWPVSLVSIGEAETARLPQEPPRDHPDPRRY